MNKSSEKILAEIYANREKCHSLTKSELEKNYYELKQKNFPVGEKISFISDIGYSTCIAYHYDLIIEDWKRPQRKQIHIGESFCKHGKEGLEFLFSELQNSTVEPESIRTAYLLAQILNYSDNTAYCERLIPYLTAYMSNDNVEYRRKALIALGWIGKEREIEGIANHILTDDDPHCRAWASTAIMQMFFHHVPGEALQNKTMEIFLNGLERETDMFTLGCMIFSIQKLWNKKLGLSNAAVERIDEAAITKSRCRALRFLRKTLNMKGTI